MPVFNTIMIGFPWAQDITLASGMIDPGDSLRADCRYEPDDAAPIFSLSSAPGDGIAINGLDVSLDISEIRSAALAAPDPGKEWRIVLLDLVKTSGGVDTHLGFRLKVPAALSVTKAAP
jgi:hypothetical protein